VQPIAGLDKLLAALPADSFDRVTAALARVADGEFRLAAVRSRGLAVLDSTIKRLDAFAKALANVARVPSANQRRATSPNPAAPAPFAPHPKATEPPDWKAIAANADKMGATIEAAFQRGVTALRGFVAVADPSAFSTLAASLNILSAEVGTVFLPYVEAASRQVQAAASWFRNLDDATKTTFARIALAGLALGGFVVVWRTLASVVAFARVAIVTTYAAMAATPLGAIAALVGVVGTLAAAWWGVNAAARAAGGAQGEAGRAGVGAGPGEIVRDLTAAEIEMLPEEYRTRFKEVERKRRDAANTADPAERQAKLEAADVEQSRLNRAYSRDLPAQQRTLPQDVLARIEKEPARRHEILAEYREKQSADLERTRSAVLDADTFPKWLDRQALALKAVQSKDAGFDFHRQAALYRERKGLRRDGNEYAAMLEDQKSPEFTTLIRTVMDAVKKIDPNADIKPEEIAAALRVNTPDPKQPGIKEMTLLPLPKRERAAVDQTEIRKAEARLSLTDILIQSAGRKDDFAQNLKPPVQSRFTDAIAFQESAQLAVLNTADADAKLLQIQMRNLTQAVGDVTKVIQDYAAAQQKGAMGTFLQGWIDLSR